MADQVPAGWARRRNRGRGREHRAMGGTRAARRGGKWGIFGCTAISGVLRVRYNGPTGSNNQAASVAVSPLGMRSWGEALNALSCK